MEKREARPGLLFIINGTGVKVVFFNEYSEFTGVQAASAADDHS